MKEFLKSLLSRKFVVFVIATVAMFMGLISGTIWAGIAGLYLGANLLRHQQEKKNGKSERSDSVGSFNCNSDLPPRIPDPQR